MVRGSRAPPSLRCRYGAAAAAEVKVMISGGLLAAYKELVLAVRESHRQHRRHRLRAVDGHDRMPPFRCGLRGEAAADVLIMVGESTRRDDRARQGPGRHPPSTWCSSPIGMVVRAGAFRSLISARWMPEAGPARAPVGRAIKPAPAAHLYRQRAVRKALRASPSE